MDSLAQKRAKKKAKRKRLLASPTYNHPTYGPLCFAQREADRRDKEKPWIRKRT